MECTETVFPARYHFFVLIFILWDGGVGVTWAVDQTIHYISYKIEYIFSQYQMLLELLLMDLYNVYIAVLPVPVAARSKA